MTRVEFVESAYEIAFGEDAYKKGYTQEEVLVRLREFSDKAYEQEVAEANDWLKTSDQTTSTNKSRQDLLVAALKRMLEMHELVGEKINFGASFFDAETLNEMIEAPLQSRIAIANIEGGL
jgi:hypothetical protein